MKILITGFAPFDNEKLNASYEAVKRLKEKINNFKVIKKELSTSFIKSVKELDGLLEQENYDFVICVGQAENRDYISLEKVGLNLMEARIKDNDGYQPEDKKIHKDGDLAYFSNLNLKYLKEKLKEVNISSKISSTAGTFVCNTTLYHLLYLINKEGCKFKAGFIHVPPLSSQRKDSQTSMDVEEIVLALETVISNLS